MNFFAKIITLVAVVFSVQTTFAQKAAMTSHDNTEKEEVTVIYLAQTPGQYETTELNLAPGKYIFEVNNKNVDKQLGFYLTPITDAKAQVPNSGLESLIDKGQTARTGIVTLAEGNYQYSCPLNPTPHYTLNVTK